MIRIAPVVACVLLLAACKPAPQKPPTAPKVEAPAATAAPIAPAATALTPEGWGAIKIGMREPEALKAAAILKATPPPHDEDWLACHQLEVSGQPDMYVMVEEEELTRLTIRGDNALKTDKGLGVGATEAQVKAAYGPTLKIEPHKYDGPGALYLTAFDPKTQRGVRYETDDKGLVSAIHVGEGSIELVEGCS